ncbi:MAG: hypothetical protein A2Z88_09070 [Omnitrophica WOR_2 bacterium GWA2_47_8]|nr:MAG: hypothetical protein A2Z88_09070 [Omnitrophica WOR_2 bacterium GWA2_47_8]
MGKRILIVDDDKTQILWVSEALKKKGHEVDTAESGAAALTKLKEYKPDLIITDVVMPEMDGFQFFKQLHIDKHLVHILVLSSRSLMSDSFAAIGAEHFLPKTCPPQVLLDKIDAILALPPPVYAREIPQFAPVTRTPVNAPEDQALLAAAPAAEKEGFNMNQLLIRGGMVVGGLFILFFGYILVSAMSGFMGVKKHDLIPKKIHGETLDDVELTPEMIKELSKP